MEKSERGTISQHWKPIEDISGDPDRFRDRELEALWQAWTDQRKTLDQTQSLAEFNGRLTREWAIETGVIEGVYTLDRGVTQTLIEHGIDSGYIGHESTNLDPELVARTVRSHADVLEGLFAFVKDERPLSTSYIKELHAQLLKYQSTTTAVDQFGREFEVELRKGDYKALPNNPTRKDGAVHEYCPPEHVASEMDRLIAIHLEHQREMLRPELQAAWLHHAFTQIHPFQDGNGRVARALASLVFIKAEYFPLLVARDDRERYITSLEVADGGDLLPLVQNFSLLQKRTLTRAIGLAVDVKPAKDTTEAVEAARDLLVNLQQIIPKEWLNAKTQADTLQTNAANKLIRVANLLKENIGKVDSTFSFSVGHLGAPPLDQIRLIAQRQQFDPDFGQYHQSHQLALKRRSNTAFVVVTVLGLGSSFRGVLGVSGYFQDGDRTPVPLSDDIFRFSYHEGGPALTQRFEAWLESALTRGIELWRRTLV